MCCIPPPVLWWVPVKEQLLLNTGKNLNWPLVLEAHGAACSMHRRTDSCISEVGIVESVAGAVFGAEGMKIGHESFRESHGLGSGQSSKGQGERRALSLTGLQGLNGSIHGTDCPLSTELSVPRIEIIRPPCLPTVKFRVILVMFVRRCLGLWDVGD